MHIDLELFGSLHLDRMSFFITRQRMIQRVSRLVAIPGRPSYQYRKTSLSTHATSNSPTTLWFSRTMATGAAPVQITAVPAAGQSVSHNGTIFKTIKEGSAYILVPPNARTSIDPQRALPQDGSQSQNVFYNPVQQFNRDLSVLAIKAYGEDMCQRKFEKHDQNSAKRAKKQEKKRKRKQDEQNEDEEEGGVKIRRTGDGEYVGVSDGVAGAAVAVAGSSSAAIARGSTASTNGNHDGEEREATSGEGASGTGHTDPSANGQDAQAEIDPSDANTRPDGNQMPEWKPRFRILDALSASGLRALRYASEISFATEVVANDRDKSAVKSIKVNVEHNKLSSSIRAATGDALGHMYGVAFPHTDSHGPSHVGSRYDVVDLDPYGTAAPFIDAALQALEDGGMLCVTCTDSGVFASCGYSEKAFALYGGMPIKGLHSHEGGLRLLLHSIATMASRHGIAIEPLLSLSIDFYARLFIRVRKSPADVKFLAGKSMLVYDCDHGCGAWTIQHIGRHQKHKNNDTNWKYSIAQAAGTNHLCEHCGSKRHVAGPMWAGPLHNPAFIEKILNDLKFADPEIYQTKHRIEGMLDTALDELIVLHDTMDLREGPLPPSPTSNAKAPPTRDIIPRTPPEAIDHFPFFFITSALCKVIKAVAPPEHMVKGALRHAGYKATRSHCRPGSIKTDAPWDVVWEVMREWVRQKSPIKEGALKEGTAGFRILQKMRKDVPQPRPVVDEDGGTHAGTPEVITEESETRELPEPPTDPKRMQVVFDAKLGKDKPGKRMVRYQENPKENWGPMRRARGTA